MAGPAPVSPLAFASFAPFATPFALALAHEDWQVSGAQGGVGPDVRLTGWRRACGGEGGGCPNLSERSSHSNAGC